MLTIYNRKKVKVGGMPVAFGSTAVSEVTIRRRLNSDYELSFLIPMIFDQYSLLEQEGLIECEGQNYIIKDIKRDRKGLGRNALITCKHIMTRLMDIKIPYESAIDESLGTDISFLTNIMSAATGGVFTFQIMETFPLKDVYKWGSSNCLNAFQDLVKLYDVEFIPDNYNIRLYKKINIDNGMQYRFKKNIVEDSYETNTSNLSTRITGLAKDSLTIINLPASHLTADEYSRLNAVPGAIVGGLIKVTYLISQYSAAWSTPDNTYFDSEFEATDIDASDEAGKVLLLEEMRKKLAANEIPDIQISMNAADLWKIDKDEPRPQLGETVLLIDPELEVNKIQARVMEITEYPFARDKQSQVTLANFLLIDGNDIIADLHGTKDLVDGLITKGNLNTSRFEAFARQALIDVTNSKTEILYPDTGGFLLQDKGNHQLQVLMKANGIIISEDGMQTVKTAVTGRGVAAEYILGILGEFAQVKTDNIIAGTAKITSAMIDTIKANQIDVSGGRITAGQIDATSLHVNSANIDGLITADSVKAGWVYTGTLTAAQVNAVAISASSITTGSLSADRINGGTLTGVTINVGTDLHVGSKIYMNAGSFTSDIVFTPAVKLYADPGGNSLHVAASGGLSVNGIQVALQGGNDFIKSLLGQDISMQYFDTGNYVEVFVGGTFKGKINLV